MPPRRQQRPPVPPAPPAVPPVPPAPPVPVPAAPRHHRPARRVSAAIFWVVVGALAALFAANLAGYGPAIVSHESVRVVLPPQRSVAQPVKQLTRHPVAPKPQVTTPVPPAPTSAVTPPAPTHQVVDVNVNVNVNVRTLQSSPSTTATPPTYHDGVVCDRYQGCTHFWVDPPMMPSAPAPYYIPPQAP